VGSGLSPNQHLTAHAVTVFGRIVAGDDLEFLDRIDRRFDGLRLEPERAAGGTRAVVDAVEQAVGLVGPLADRDERALGADFTGRTIAVPVRACRRHTEPALRRL